MFKLSKISPVLRAVGVIGGTAALVTGVTFANLTSNAVSLSPNTLDTATANLQIGGDNGTNCATANAGPVSGLSATLTPGVASAPRNFCLKNTGDVALNVTVGVPQGVFVSGVAPNQVTLTITCTGNSPVSGTLDQFTGGSAVVTPLSIATAVDCTATATLNPSYTDNTGQAVPTFSIDFVGTQA